MLCSAGFKSPARSRKPRRLLDATRREVMGPGIQSSQREQRRKAISDRWLRGGNTKTWPLGMRDRKETGCLGKLNGWIDWGCLWVKIISGGGKTNQLGEKMSLLKVNSFKPFLLYTAPFFSLYRLDFTDSLKSTEILTFGLQNYLIRE